MSHNVYCEDLKEISTKCCNYLIFNGKFVTPSNNLTQAIRIAKEEKRLCTIFESVSTKGHFWKYFCDISYNILAGEFNE